MYVQYLKLMTAYMTSYTTSAHQTPQRQTCESFFFNFYTIPLQDNLGRIKVSIPETMNSSSGVQELVKGAKEKFLQQNMRVQERLESAHLGQGHWFQYWYNE